MHIRALARKTRAVSTECRRQSRVIHLAAEQAIWEARQMRATITWRRLLLALKRP
jgi:hypothetical protein